MDDKGDFRQHEGPIRIMVVEDQVLLADCLEGWFKSKIEFELLGIARNATAARELCVRENPQVALVDIELPDGDGIQVGRELLQRNPNLRVLLMSGRVDPHTIWRARESGLHGFFDKSQNPEALKEALRKVAYTGVFYSNVVEDLRRSSLAQPDAFYKILSHRELDILRHVVAGETDKQISAALEVTPLTVATHRRNIRKKLEVSTDRELIAYARRWGLDPGPAIK